VSSFAASLERPAIKNSYPSIRKTVMASRASLALKSGGAIAIFLLSFWATLRFIDSKGAGQQNATQTLAVESKGGRSDPGWPKFTMRILIPASAVKATGRGVSVKFAAGKAAGFTIGKAYIGHGAASDAPYQFEGTPVQLRFKGAAGVHMAPGESVVSDEAGFTIAKGKNLIVSYYVDDATNADPVASPPAPGWATYYKQGDDAALVSPTGYSSPRVSAVSHGVLEISVQSVDH
jgi:hypothetical protein